MSIQQEPSKPSGESSVSHGSTVGTTIGLASWFIIVRGPVDQMLGYPGGFSLGLIAAVWTAVWGMMGGVVGAFIGPRSR
ncbi:MAG: hypothetical protein HY673_13880 [Chloroflexi bacterium]|nr:hypothetical protein [Chloroflexota bacterium]